MELIPIKYLNTTEIDTYPYKKLTDVNEDTAYQLLKYIVFQLNSEATLSRTCLRIYMRDIEEINKWLIENELRKEVLRD